MTTQFTLQLAVPMTLVWLATMLSPLLTRREIFFSVTVPADFRDSPEAKATLHGYWWRLSLLFVGFLAASWVTWNHLGSIRLPLWVLFYVVCAVPLLLWGRRAALRHATRPTTVREANLSPIRESPFEGLGWELFPFLVMALSGAFLVAHWSEIPLRFPIHYNASGEPNGWANRSPWGVLAILFFELLALVGLIFGRLVMFMARRAKAMDLGLRRSVSRSLLIFEWFGALLASRIALVPLWPAPMRTLGIASAAGTFGFVLLLLVMIVRARRETIAPRSDGTDETRWKAGFLYVNPDDPAIFVEKRFGFGWTLNFGHPVSYVFMLVLLGIVVSAFVVATKQ